MYVMYEVYDKATGLLAAILDENELGNWMQWGKGLSIGGDEPLSMWYVLPIGNGSRWIN